MLIYGGKVHMANNHIAPSRGHWSLLVGKWSDPAGSSHYCSFRVLQRTQVVIIYRACWFHGQSIVWLSVTKWRQRGEGIRPWHMQWHTWPLFGLFHSNVFKYSKTQGTEPPEMSSLPFENLVPVLCQSYGRYVHLIIWIRSSWLLCKQHGFNSWQICKFLKISFC